MRRQARVSAGGALVVRTASALQVWLWLLIFIFQNEFSISSTIQPGYLDFDNLPETNFTCEGKVIGGYYADLETSCQMFHVCTVGQQEEPMDIKFLCLNGTVFDQETRVCERVDEVDCTKSEKFYSLNLELYGSTAPPIISTEKTKPQSSEQTKPQSNREDNSDPTLEESNLQNNKNDGQAQETQDSTEDPIQELNIDNSQKPHSHITTTHASANIEPEEEDVEEEEEEEEIDGENPEYEDDYTKTVPVVTTQPSITTTTKPLTTTIISSTSNSVPSPISLSIASPSPTPTHISHSSQSLPPTAPAQPTLDPALLSPQEFIYRHRGPGSEAISFQRQGFRPADGVYITHAPSQPQQQYEHYPYESSRTAPRPGAPRPGQAFVQRPSPTPFHTTTSDPRDQLIRPGPTSQSSEKHETSVKHKQQSYLPPLPAQRPLPFDPYYYDRKRSDGLGEEGSSSLAARSVAPPTITERPPSKPKSPPRVIVTASASVSDSNGKRLNYTVGNVVSAVKPIVPINYDDYKESDLIFDPFFLDVPKLQKRRKTRDSIKNQKIFTVPDTATISLDLAISKTTTPKVASQATTTRRSHLKPTTTTTTTAAWNPNDYVDDNYEPLVYIPPVPPLAILLPYDGNKHKEKEKPSSNVREEKNHRDQKSKAVLLEESKSISPPSVQSTSSQSTAAASSHPALHSIVEHACKSFQCRNRA